MDFNKLLGGLQGWPAAAVLIVVILAVAWVIVTIIKKEWD